MILRVKNRFKHRFPEYSAKFPEKTDEREKFDYYIVTKKNILYFVSLLFIIVAFFACSKKTIPAKVTGLQSKAYDVATFNYVYVEGIKQKLLGNSGEALKHFEQCLKINTESDAVYYQMAQIVISNGDNDNGKKYIKKAISIDEKNLWYIMMLSSLYYQNKEIDSAIIFYEKAIKFYPGKEDLQLTLGNLYSEKGNYERANLIFDTLDKKYGVNETSTLAAVKSLMLAKRYDEALNKVILLLQEYPGETLYNGLLAEIYRGKDQNDKALEVYKKLIENDPDDPQTLLSYSDFLIDEKKFDDLFTLLNSLILNNKISREDKIAIYLRLIEDGQIKEEKLSQLNISLMVLEANYKDDDIIPLIRPEVLIKQGKLTEASERLEEIIKNKPENYYAWEKLLLVYLQLEDYDKLMIRGEECSTQFNRSFIAKILYANGALEKGKYEVALEELKKAEILASDNKIYLVQVLTMRADVYYRMKDYQKAFEIFELTLKINQDDLTVINNYAYYLAEQDIRLNEAEQMAKKVIEKEKANNTFLDTYGWVLYKRGKLKEAAKVMENIINSGEKPDAVWYEHYGYILKKQNKCKEAVVNWNVSLKLDSTKSYLLKEIKSCEK